MYAMHCTKIVLRKSKVQNVNFLWRVLYNSPVSDEIPVLMPNDNMSNRDVVLHYRDGGLRHISELHRSYDPLQYPLLFPHGTNGWYVNLKLQNDILYYCYVSYYG